MVKEWSTLLVGYLLVVAVNTGGVLFARFIGKSWFAIRRKKGAEHAEWFIFGFSPLIFVSAFIMLAANVAVVVLALESCPTALAIAADCVVDILASPGCHFFATALVAYCWVRMDERLFGFFETWQARFPSLLGRFWQKANARLV